MTKTRKDGSRGALRIDYGDPRKPEKPIAWLWKFIDGAKTAGELYGRALVVIAAEQYASRLVVPQSQQHSPMRWPSHKDHARKALAKLAGPHLPATLKQVEKAVAKAHAEHEKATSGRTTISRAAGGVDEPAGGGAGRCRRARRRARRRRAPGREPRRPGARRRLGGRRGPYVADVDPGMSGWQGELAESSLCHRTQLFLAAPRAGRNTLRVWNWPLASTLASAPTADRREWSSLTGRPRPSSTEATSGLRSTGRRRVCVQRDAPVEPRQRSSCR